MCATRQLLWIVLCVVGTSLVPLVSAAIEQAPLPYPVNALEPWMSAESLNWHYKLHGVYVARTNELVKGTIWDNVPLQLIVMSVPFKSELYNNSLQAFNHNFQWYILGPPPPGGAQPVGNLANAIQEKHGGLEGLKGAFVAASCRVLASGYVALVKGSMCLDVVVTGDADNTTRLGLGIPLVVVDLWEHAYYLDTRINRVKHIYNTFNIVNWDQANRLYHGDLSLLFAT